MRNNFVLLIGKLIKVEEKEISGWRYMETVVATDSAALGGHHTVLVPGEKVMKLLKTAMANSNDDLEVFVTGFLANGMVVAEHVVLLVNEEKRAKILQQMKLDR